MTTTRRCSQCGAYAADAYEFQEKWGTYTRLVGLSLAYCHRCAPRVERMLMSMAAFHHPTDSEKD